MSKKVLLSWDKPLSLVNWERERDKDVPVRSGLMILSISLILHSIALFIIYRLEDRTEMLPFLALGLAITSLSMPTWHYLEMKNIYLHPEKHYEFREDGILLVYYRGESLYPWKGMISYKIEQNHHLPQLKNLTISSGLEGSPRRCLLIFDPVEVPEEKIKALLAEKTNAHPIPS